MNFYYIMTNLLKNALAPFLVPMYRTRGSLGIDGNHVALVETLNRLAPLLAARNLTLSKKMVIELGPGRTADLMATFVACGAEKALGFDVNPEMPKNWNNPNKFIALSQLLCSEATSSFRNALKIRPEKIQARIRALSKNAWPITYSRFKGDRIPLDDRTTALIYSVSVMEHVRKKGIANLLAEQFRVMEKGAIGIHIIDLRDHMKIDGNNIIGDWLDCLRYPESLFNAMFWNRSTYINRLRAWEWKILFSKAGFDIAYWKNRYFPLPKNFDCKHLNKPWGKMITEDFSIGYIDVTLFKL